MHLPTRTYILYMFSLQQWLFPIYSHEYIRPHAHTCTEEDTTNSISHVPYKNESWKTWPMIFEDHEFNESYKDIYIYIYIYMVYIYTYMWYLKECRHGPHADAYCICVLSSNDCSLHQDLIRVAFWFDLLYMHATTRNDVHCRRYHAFSESCRTYTMSHANL